jgi:hydroxyacylglutathione hydrolase
MNIPLNHLEERLADIPPARPVIVFCAGGYRSSLAVSLLQRRGRRNVAQLPPPSAL